MKKLLILTLLIFTSCSQINQESKTYYYENNNPVRHGIVPIEKTEKNKVKASPINLNEKTISKGKTVYQQNCQSCHGINADGNGPMKKSLNINPRNLVKMAKEVPQFKFYIMVSRWQGKMPGWNNLLSDKEISQLEQYIRSLALKE